MASIGFVPPNSIRRSPPPIPNSLGTSEAQSPQTTEHYTKQMPNCQKWIRHGCILMYTDETGQEKAIDELARRWVDQSIARGLITQRHKASLIPRQSVTSLFRSLGRNEGEARHPRPPRQHPRVHRLHAVPVRGTGPRAVSSLLNCYCRNLHLDLRRHSYNVRQQLRGLHG